MAFSGLFWGLTIGSGHLLRPVEKLYPNGHCGFVSKPIPRTPGLGHTHALFSAPRAYAAASSHIFSIPPSTALRMTVYTSFLLFVQLDLRPRGNPSSQAQMCDMFHFCKSEFPFNQAGRGSASVIPGSCLSPGKCQGVRF